jgi:primase-polymerase (primpol)-like protein
MNAPIIIQADTIPDAMRQERRWVVWRLVQRHGKRTKVPYQAAAPSVEAKSTDPKTWGDFDHALTTHLLGKAEGIGFVLGAGWVGFDQDHTLDLVHLRVLNTYTEWSPSGRGAHAIARGTKPGGRCRTGQFEPYGDGRYFTVTGHHIDGFPTTVEERTPEIAALYAHLFGDDDHEPVQADAEPPIAVGSVDDDELLIQMAGADNGDKFLRLWRGQWAGMYPSQSEADSALACMFAFWTGGDAERMDRLFRRSALIRAKWDARRGDRTYGARVIANALRVASLPTRPRTSALPYSAVSGLQGLRGL